MTASPGEFSADGREYVIRVHTNAGVVPPAPWANVVGHQTFGFVATELGPGFTWSENSHNNRLTPWRNDPVRDPQAEALFVRDDDTGLAWSVTPLPAGGGEDYVARHGQGYTSWDHSRDGIQSNLRVFVPPDDRVKVFRLALRNQSSARRHLSITFYAEWVLGDDRGRTAPHIVTSRDPATGAVMATNAFRETFGGRVAFVDLHPGTYRTVTGDRMEFLGRNGSLTAPAALGHDMLSNRVGAILDACGAIQVRFTLEPSQEQTVVGLLGEAVDLADLRRIVATWREPGAVDRALEQVRQGWDRLLGTIQVRTPDRSTDLMLNRWLLYQTLACRVWGRSGFYQSGGAFGFRDQLQDVLALLHAAPQIAREQLLRAASRQFLEGDVQHWWHEPGGRGVRTRFSDDRLWLVYATLHYVASTGDDSVLDESFPSSTAGRSTRESTRRTSCRRSRAIDASLYEHCVRAVEISLADRSPRLAAHGIRRLERRHEPGGQRGPRGERLARVGSFTRSSDRSRTSRGGAASWIEPTGIVVMRRRSRRRSRTPGTATGTVARTSMMERRSGRRRTKSVRSTRLPSPGPSFPARAFRSERAKRWSRSTSVS